MSFWTEPSTEPTRKFRFSLRTPDFSFLGDNDLWWWAKSVDKPTYNFNTNEYQLTNHKFKYPGILSWEDINITIVDDGTKNTSGTRNSRAQMLVDNLRYMYQPPSEDTGDSRVGQKPSIPETGFDGSIDEIIIEQLGANGKAVETWTLYDAFVKSVSFGSLAYSDDELVEITLGISYDYATLITSTAENTDS